MIKCTLNMHRVGLERDGEKNIKEERALKHLLKCKNLIAYKKITIYILDNMLVVELCTVKSCTSKHLA